MLCSENCHLQWAVKCCNLIAELENWINGLLKNVFIPENGKVIKISTLVYTLIPFQHP